MAQTPEGKVKAKVKAWLKARGIWFSMPMGTQFGNSGVPDFLACHEGHFIGIEAKAGKGKTTALQEDNMRRIRESGGTTIVVNEDNMVELLTLLGGKND